MTDSNYLAPVATVRRKDDEYEPLLGENIKSYREEKELKQKFSDGGVRTLIGGFLVCLSFGSDFSYSNINTYLTSYMRVNGYNDNLSYMDFVFLTTTKTIITGAAMPWLGGLARKMGPKIAVAIGSAIYSCGYILTYITVQLHFAFAIFSLSLHGVGFCLVYATAIRTAQAWFPLEKKGLIASIVVSGYGFGSSLWTPIQTGFVNPDNLKAGGDVANCTQEVIEPEVIKPEVIEPANCTDSGSEIYFTNPDVLDRVPLMFVILGIIYAVMGFIAVLLISEPKGELIEDDESEDKDIPKIDQNKADRINLSPRQVLKTKWFYQIWTGFFGLTLTNAIIAIYSKTFGLTFINDDHFYSVVAVFQNILNGFSRIFWGFSYDRFGFKKCFSLICVVVCLTILTLPLLPGLGDGQGSRVCYGVWMCLLYSTCPGIYAIIAAEVSQAFGPLHYQANFGLLFTQNIAYSLVIIIITKGMFTTLGYSGMFFVAGGFGMLGLLAVIGRWKMVVKGYDEI